MKILVICLVVVCELAMAAEIDSAAALKNFLTDSKPKLGLFEQGAQIVSIRRMSENYEPLRFRIQTTSCIADATFSDEKTYRLRSISCAGEDFAKDFAADMVTAPDKASFGKAIVGAYRAGILEKETILRLSLEGLGHRLTAGLSNQDGMAWLDDALTAFFVGGHGVSGGWVEKGEIKSPLMQHILSQQSYGTVRALQQLKARLNSPAAN